MDNECYLLNLALHSEEEKKEALMTLRETLFQDNCKTLSSEEKKKEKKTFCSIEGGRGRTIEKHSHIYSIFFIF